MKKTIFILLFISQSALALPIVCESVEMIGEAPTLRFKINKSRKIRQNGKIFDLNPIGVVPRGEGERRQIVYGSGALKVERISMNIVDKGWLSGYIDANSPDSNGLFTGKAKIGGVLKGRMMDITCTDEEIHGEVRP